MRSIGKILIVGAIVMMAFYFAYNFNLNKQVEEDTNSYIEETSVVEEVDNNETIETEEIKEEKKELKPINYTAVLEIPSINLKRGVVDSTKNFNSINYAISVDKNSNYPNEYGNFILYAHSGNSSIAYFRGLNKVNINDKVYVYFNGIKYEYSIVNKYDIKKTGKAKVLDSNTEKYITLITCNQNRKGYQTIVVGKMFNQVNY